jgi:hypothetical protein
MQNLCIFASRTSPIDEKVARSESPKCPVGGGKGEGKPSPEESSRDFDRVDGFVDGFWVTLGGHIGVTF